MTLDDFIKKPVKKSTKKMIIQDELPKTIKANSQVIKKNIKNSLITSLKQQTKKLKKTIEYKKSSEIIFYCRKCKEYFKNPDYDFGFYTINKCPNCNSTKTNKTWEKEIPKKKK